MNPLSFRALFVISLVAVGSRARIRDVLEFVNPFIGTLGGGHVFPGATLPFGMAKASADTTSSNNQGGFTTDGAPITGFSHMHDSGTGGGISLGNFPLFPYAGCSGDVPSGCKFVFYSRQTARAPGSAVAEPGYFAVTLKSQVTGEATVTSHSALYRFTFPDTPVEKNATLSPLILADLNDLSHSRSNGSMSVDSTTGRITGTGTFVPSFGEGNYNLYFCSDFQGASIKSVGTWQNYSPQNSTNFTATNGATQGGAFVYFDKPADDNQILARVGLSFISTEQACSNAQDEIPDFDFNGIRSTAAAAWRQKFNVIKLQPGKVNDDFQTIFWSGVYRSMISPQDYTGENPLWQSDEPYYDSYYCIWDSFRSIHPLITLFDPASQAKMVRSLIDIYRHTGYLPDCRMSLDKGFTQGGSNADVVLADSYLKNITDGIDWETGYAAVVKDAEVEPSNWDVEGRGNLDSYHSLGYIPKDDVDTKGSGLMTRSISRTVEYAYNDLCIAEMAKVMGKSADYEKYSGRASNWKTLFKANQTSKIGGKDTGFVGFLQPKNLDGTWDYQDPVLCSPLLNPGGCYLNPTGHETYEGSCWLYTFFVPGDQASLIKTLGGRQKFVSRLRYLHDSGLLYIGDEQAFINVFLYHYAGRPGLSARQSHIYIPSLFNTTHVGIPGNDDSGAMGSFVALSMLGLFPNPGQNVYLITPPYFPSWSLTNPQTGKVATVRNVNFDPTYKTIYIQSAKLNGKRYTKNWIDHSFFLNGGVLELVLGEKESSWGTADEDLPPSLSTTGMHL